MNLFPTSPHSRETAPPKKRSGRTPSGLECPPEKTCVHFVFYYCLAYANAKTQNGRNKDFSYLPQYSA